MLTPDVMEKGDSLMMTSEENDTCEAFLRGPIHSQIQNDWKSDDNFLIRQFLTVAGQYTVTPETEARWKSVLMRVEEDMKELESVRFIKGTFRYELGEAPK